MTQPSAPEPGTDIDYEALGRAVFLLMPLRPMPEDIGLAAVAALRDQGFVVVRAEDLDTYFFGDDPESRRNAFDRLNAVRDAALVAAQVSAEGGNG